MIFEMGHPREGCLGQPGVLKEKEEREDFVWKKNWDLKLRREC